MPHWHILTGEYPPQPGGVADYTFGVAGSLAAAGEDVCVWAPPTAGSTSEISGVAVQRLPDCFGPRGLLRLDRALRRLAGPIRVLVQYVPHMYGCRAMNVPLCLWLRFACPVRPWVMIHEVAYPVIRGQPLRQNVLGLIQRRMAALVAKSAERVFVSTLAWEPLLIRLAPGAKPMTWLPVPSNLPAEADPAAVAVVRSRICPLPRTTIIGHFGTLGCGVDDLLAACLPPLLRADGRRVALLVGRGGGLLADRLRSEHPKLAGQVQATGALDPEVVAAHLRACDVLIQPYSDGVSGRRTSLMAGMALGVPVVTNRGSATEPVWEQGLVALTPGDDPATLTAAVERLLADAAERRRVGATGQAGYRCHFSLEHTIRRLLAPWPPAEEATPRAEPVPTVPAEFRPPLPYPRQASVAAPVMSAQKPTP